MFLAIINDTYGEVKADLASQKNEFELGDYIKRGVMKVMKKVGVRNKLNELMNSEKLANEEGQITLDKIREQLKK